MSEFPLQPAAKGPYADSAGCVYCRGTLRHMARQRCPAAPPTAPPAPPVTVAPQRGVFAGDTYGYQAYRARPYGNVQASPFGFWRFVGAAGSTSLLMACLTVYFVVLFDDLTSASQDPDILILWVAAAMFGVVGAMMLLWVSSRTLAKVVFSLMAATLIIVGFFMLVFAPVYRQINDPGIAEYRASNVMYLFGTLTFVWGLALAVACVRWALEPAALQQLNRWRRPLGAGYGIVLSLFGLMFLSLLAFIIAAPDDGYSEEEFGLVAGVIAITAFGAQFFVPGMLLTYHGTRASMGRRSSEFRPPIGALVVLAFGAVLLVGQLNMRMESPLAWPMPPLHVLAAALPGIAYIAFASRGSWLRGKGVRGLSWRQLMLAWGLAIAVGAMSAAFVNSIAGLGVTVLLLVHNGAFEDVSAITSSGFFSDYTVWDVIADAEFLLTSNEQWVANIIAIAIVPPLGEEFLKGLSVRLLMRRNTTRAQAFALGAAAGAGFGFVEALLYGAGVVTDDLSAWWEIMLIRAGSTSLHCLNTGLVGVAWWYWSIANRKRPALGLFFLAVFFHALWNGFSVTLYSEIFWIDTLDDATLERIVYVFVGLIAGAFILALPLVARWLREPPPPPVDMTPLGGMQPWMAY